MLEPADFAAPSLPVRDDKNRLLRHPIAKSEMTVVLLWGIYRAWPYDSDPVAHAAITERSMHRWGGSKIRALFRCCVIDDNEAPCRREHSMKIYSWNVNGIRAVMKKGTFQ